MALPKREPGRARSSTGDSSPLGRSSHAASQASQPVPVTSSQASSQILKNRFQEACAIVKTRDGLTTASLADALGMTEAQLRHALSNDPQRVVGYALVAEVERMANTSSAWGDDMRLRLATLIEQRWDLDREIEQMLAIRGAA